MSAVDSSEPQLSARFTTHLEQLRVTDAPIQIPTRLTRAGLSEVVNHLLAALDASHTQRPFDFLLNGTLVRGSIGEALGRHGLSGEAVVTLEYVECLPPPRPERSCAHEDWIGGLATHPGGGGLVLSACYNNAAYVYDARGKQLAALTGHTAAVKAVTWMRGATPQSSAGAQRGSTSGSGMQVFRAASASKDHTLRTWRVAMRSEGAGGGVNGDAAVAVESACEACLVGHTSSVESVASNPAGEMLASGAWDGAVHVWAAAAASGETGADSTEGASKRAKGRRGEVAPTAAPPAELRPTSTLSGHQGSVNAVCWPTAPLLYTGSWDGTIREWQVESGRNSATLAGQPAVLSLDVSLASALIASAHTDHMLRLWDSRLEQGAMRLRMSHPGWVSDVRWCPNHPHVLATACYDGAIRLWDVRSTVPLHEMRAHEGGKALCVAWDGQERLASGGSDAALRFAALSVPAGP